MRILFYVHLYILIFVACSCNTDTKPGSTTESTTKKSRNIPEFNADSAYHYIKAQVDFGPRIPNSLAHGQAGDYLISQFKKYGATVTVQAFTASTFDNQKINLRNIIASFHPEKKKRILLAAHWDTRPFADKDPEKPNSTFDGANDGASGVGVLLEIARVIQQQPPSIGIDIILFDGEDWGERDNQQDTHPLPPGLTEWWCLGSQQWARNKHQSNYSASFGILLDMVGGKNARFAKEGYSLEYAPGIVDKIWNTAGRLGFSHIFLQEQTSFATDDHKFVNEVAKIPMVDILCYEPVSGFGDFHHTRKDNLEIISKETLSVVGKTVLNVIYYE